MKLTRRSQTYDDIVEIATYIGTDAPSVADRFYDAVENTLKTLCTVPKIGSQRLSKDGKEFRIWFVTDFPNILILYKEYPDEIEILRVIHSARDYSRFI